MKLNNNDDFATAMEPMCNMFPYLLLVARFLDSRYKDLEGPTPFACQRISPSAVPQKKKKDKVITII